MKRTLIAAVAIAVFTGSAILPQSRTDNAKPRIVISSDFPPLDVIAGGLNQGPPEKRSDPDDVQSMVRFLTYANEFRVEGLIASAATLANIVDKRNILDVLDRYAKVEANLRLHDPAFPTAAELRRVTTQGLAGAYGKPARQILGEDKDSEASEFIIRLIDGDDPAPVWFCIWGGSRELGQALWKVRHTRTPADVEKFVSKVRVYFIAKQDGSTQWMLDEFPGLFALLSERAFPGMSYRAKGSAPETGDLAWLNANVREGHGPLGALYPRTAWNPKYEAVYEGDTPSFLYVLSGATGLSDTEEPPWGGWGGRFRPAAESGKHWLDAAEGAEAVTRWHDARQRDFAARMDWCVKPYAAANHAPIATLNGNRGTEAVRLEVSPGQSVTLSASGSSDPDRHGLKYRWWQYREPGTYDGAVAISDSDAASARVAVPADAANRTIHIMLEVMDNGTPALTSYRRAVVAVRGAAGTGALAGQRHRVIVSSDIGGTDPDDFQSMVHFLLYADVFDVEGILSSPFGPGRREHILQVIDHYEQDYARLKTHSPHYPSPAVLRAITKQGALDSAGPAGAGTPTEGSAWIIRCARRPDPRPLYVLVWGGIEDLAQALHDAPDILPKLRVYFIGGPNKMWSVDAYNYIEQNHPKLWIIEANQTYRGWFVGGNQSGEWGNTAFVTAHIAGRGALGDFFVPLLKGIKMGDSPSVGYLLRGTPKDPSRPGWGGQFVRVWGGRKTVFDRLTNEADEAEAFGVVEWALPVPAGMNATHNARMLIDGRIPAAAARDGDVLRFRFSPRDAKVWTYTIQSDFPALNGSLGRFTAVLPPYERTSRASNVHPNWWIDDPDPAAAEGVHQGAKHVGRWREEFLRDFAARMLRCQTPAGK